MADELDINPLIEKIQHNAARRIEMEQRYFSVSMEHIHQMESTINLMALQQLQTIENILRAEGTREKIQSLFTHGAVQETAIASSRNPVVKLYKKALFKILKPMLTHQQEFNRLTAELIQQQQGIMIQFAEVLNQNLLTLSRYSLELIKGLIRASTLMLDDFNAETTSRINKTRRRVRIGIVHLHNLYMQMKQLIQEKGTIDDQLSRRMRIGLIHLHNIIRRNSEESAREMSQLSGRSDALSRRISEIALDISTSIKDIAKQGSQFTDKATSAETEAKSSTSIYNDPLFFNFARFEEYVRGEGVADHFSMYLPYFKERGRVLDIGCGTGTFLTLLRDNNIGAYGVDIDRRNIDACKAKGLEAVQADAVAHLDSLEKGSIDGLIAAQLIEHLEFATLVQLLRQSFLKLKPGSPIILETVNTTCLTIYSGSFFADPTHIKPVHPVTLSFALEQIGFEKIKREYIHPFNDVERLQMLGDIVQNVRADSSELQDIARMIDENSQKLNSILFSFKDYAVIAYKP